jgi:hypothetical protein
MCHRSCDGSGNWDTLLDLYQAYDRLVSGSAAEPVSPKRERDRCTSLLLVCSPSAPPVLTGGPIVAGITALDNPDLISPRREARWANCLAEANYQRFGLMHIGVLA